MLKTDICSENHWLCAEKRLTTTHQPFNIRASSTPVGDNSALAQLVEQMTVNHWVAGSSPAGGAIFSK